MGNGWTDKERDLDPDMTSYLKIPMRSIYKPFMNFGATCNECFPVPKSSSVMVGSACE